MRPSPYNAFRRFAHSVALAVGAPAAFALALLLVIVWGVTGPLFHYSDSWQLTINTGTTIVTFLMVFVIQNTQNRDSQVVQPSTWRICPTSPDASHIISRLTPASRRGKFVRDGLSRTGEA